MSKLSEALGISMDGGITPEGNAEELDLTGGGGEVIDPKQVAEEATGEIEDKRSKKDNSSLNIIDETGKEEEDEDEEEESEESEDGSDDPSDSLDNDDSNDDNSSDDDESGTFQTIGKHFADEGLLEGYEEDMEDTPEAFQSMIEKTIEKGVEDYKNSFANPLSKQFLDYIENGGDPGQFMNMVSGPDYTKIDPDRVADSEAMQKQLLRDQLAAQGEDQNEIEDIIEAFENSGQLEKQANRALGKLQKSQVKQREDAIEAQKQQAADIKKKNQERLEELETTINSAEEIGGFNLTKKSKKQFYDYMTKIDPKTGKTKLMADSQNEDKQLLMAYLYFNDFKFDKLEKKIASKETKSLAEKLGRHTDTSARGKAKRRTKAPANDKGSTNMSILKKALK